MTASGAIVIGAGPAGLVSALALSRAGIEPLVYERRTAPAAGGSGLTLWPNALRALESIGLADEVRAISAPAAGIAVRSWRGTVLSTTDEQSMRDRYGDVGAVLERGDLLRVLARAQPAGVVQTGRALASVTAGDHTATVRFADQDTVRARLVVGADGMRSRVRAATLGDLPLSPAGYTVWRGIAHLALDARAGTLTLGRGAQFGLFPMRGGRVYWFATLPASRRHATAAELLEAFAGWHEPVELAIAATDPAAIVVTDVMDARPLARRHAGCAVLVGDAAHPSTPALGQGACQAIEDAVVLGRCLGAACGDVAAALREYERRRVGRTNRMTIQARRMGRVGQWRSRPACWLRERLIASAPQWVGRRDLDWQFTFDG